MLKTVSAPFIGLDQFGINYTQDDVPHCTTVELDDLSNDMYLETNNFGLYFFYGSKSQEGTSVGYLLVDP